MIYDDLIDRLEELLLEKLGPKIEPDDATALAEEIVAQVRRLLTDELRY